MLLILWSNIQYHTIHTFPFFCRYGIDEDPVTGSSFSVLVPYWAGQLGVSDGRVMRARQCSRRGGEVELELMEGSRVKITGQAAIVSAGYIAV